MTFPNDPGFDLHPYPMDDKDKFPMSQDKYVDSGGYCCPFCGSENVLEGGINRLDDGDAQAIYRCIDCEKRYLVLYMLDGYEDTEEVVD